MLLENKLCAAEKYKLRTYNFMCYMIMCGAHNFLAPREKKLKVDAIGSVMLVVGNVVLLRKKVQAKTNHRINTIKFLNFVFTTTFSIFIRPRFRCEIK